MELTRTVPKGAMDWVLLGMGGDGHTASIFPGSADATAGDDGKLVILSQYFVSRWLARWLAGWLVGWLTR